MNDIDFYNRIKELIETGVSNFHALETEVSTLMSSHGATYRKSNERPIAALMTTHIANGFPELSNPKEMQELPLAGMSQTIIDALGDRMKALKSEWVETPKYSSYNVDGFVSFEDGVNKKDLFLEYKVESGFKELKLLIDYVKYLIYTNNASQQSYFAYISFNKSTTGSNSFIPRTNNFEMIDPTSLTAPDPEAIFHYCKNVPSVTLSEEEVTEALETVIALDCYNETIEANPLERTPRDFSSTDAYKFRDIYGKNALLSYKARTNAYTLSTVAGQIISAERMTGDIDRIIYTRIKASIEELKIIQVGNNIRTNASKRLSHQSTNWLLAIIKVGVDSYWSDQVEQYTLRIEDRDGDGNATSSRPADFDKMLRAIELKFVYGQSQELAQEFAKTELTVAEFLAERQIDMPQKSSQFRALVKRMMYHINAVYTSILTLEEDAPIAVFNDEYKKFKTRRSQIDIFNKIKTTLPLSIKTRLKINYNSTSISVQSEIKTILTELANKWNPTPN